jgi:hypothetical protein
MTCACGDPRRTTASLLPRSSFGRRTVPHCMPAREHGVEVVRAVCSRISTEGAHTRSRVRASDGGRGYGCAHEYADMRHGGRGQARSESGGGGATARESEIANAKATCAGANQYLDKTHAPLLLLFFARASAALLVHQILHLNTQGCIVVGFNR